MNPIASLSRNFMHKMLEKQRGKIKDKKSDLEIKLKNFLNVTILLKKISYITKKRYNDFFIFRDTQKTNILKNLSLL